MKTKPILLTALFLAAFAGFVKADPIKVTDVTGKFTSTVEIIEIVGTSVKIKEANGGKTKLVPLSTFDNDSLIRIIGELGRQADRAPVAQRANPAPDNARVFETGNQPIEMTLKRLSVLGEEFVGKTVRFSNAEFYKISQGQITSFPMVQIRTNGLLTTYRKEEAKKWVNFVFDDVDGETCWYTLANKKQWVEFLLNLERDELLNVEGIVVELPTNDDYGIILTALEKVSESAMAVKVPKPSLKGPFTKPTCEIQLLSVIKKSGSTYLPHQITNHSKYSIKVFYFLQFFDENGDFLGENLNTAGSPLKPGESRIIKRSVEPIFVEGNLEIKAKISVATFKDIKTGGDVPREIERKLEIVITKQLE
jgi:hypothetical protein